MYPVLRESRDNEKILPVTNLRGYVEKCDTGVELCRLFGELSHGRRRTITCPH
jgi:hypothetical protein